MANSTSTARRYPPAGAVIDRARPGSRPSPRLFHADGGLRDPADPGHDGGLRLDGRDRLLRQRPERGDRDRELALAGGLRAPRAGDLAVDEERAGVAEDAPDLGLVRLAGHEE